MCGIIGQIGRPGGSTELLACLENLEYRGYDSAGVAMKVEGEVGFDVAKRSGEISAVADAAEGLDGSLGIGHTRWSTHGRPTRANAHPHLDCEGTVAVVHNGIIDNHEELRARLEADGHLFRSETDTEVVPHLVEHYRSAGMDVGRACREAVSDVSGSYALAMLSAESDRLVATRSGSPLVLGVADEGYFLASDVIAFLEYTDRVVYLEDGQFIEVDADGYRVTDADGRPVDVEVERVSWNPEESTKGTFDHYMRKEIDEQPYALRQAIDGRVRPEAGTVDLDNFPPGAFEEVDHLQFVGCGTSYHAALYGAQLCRHRDVPATAHLASEYASNPPPVDEGTLVVGVTQSGETADTLRAVLAAGRRGARTLALTNVVGSSAAREFDEALYIRAGPEIGVAATKTFSSQVVTLVLLVERIWADTVGDPAEREADRRRLFAAIEALPEDTETVIESTAVRDVAARFDGATSHFFVGRDTGHTVALEGALKFKEITYEHAEGFASGELKHGPLALVTDETPVVGILDGYHSEKTRHNLAEASTRDAPVIAVTSDHSAVDGVADAVLEVPGTHPELVHLLANVQLQLFAYCAAVRLDRPIDKPRNLAKSVTVE